MPATGPDEAKRFYAPPADRSGNIARRGVFPLHFPWFFVSLCP